MLNKVLHNHVSPSFIYILLPHFNAMPHGCSPTASSGVLHEQHLSVPHHTSYKFVTNSVLLTLPVTPIQMQKLSNKLKRMFWCPTLSKPCVHGLAVHSALQKLTRLVPYDMMIMHTLSSWPWCIYIDVLNFRLLLTSQNDAVIALLALAQSDSKSLGEGGTIPGQSSK